MQLERSERTKRIMILAAVAVCLLMYPFIIKMTGFSFPCLFHEVTGLYCPGCGMTHMCMHILHFDFKEAFQDNMVAFVTLPLLLYLVGTSAYGYVSGGLPVKMQKANNVVAVILIVAFVTFGVVRNII